MGTVTFKINATSRRCIKFRIGVVCIAYWLCSERFKDRLLKFSFDFLVRIDPVLVVESWPRAEL